MIKYESPFFQQSFRFRLGGNEMLYPIL